MKQKKSLKRSLLVMAVIPVLILGMVVTYFAMERFTKTMHEEVECELSYMAHAVDDMLNMVYPGDYVLYGDKILTLVKGEDILNDRSEYIDAIKEDTGLEVSIFHENIRFLSTIENKQGEKILGTFSHVLVEKDVLESGEAQFYDSVEIGDKRYFAYYLPLFNSDGSCVGMIGVAKSASEVEKMIQTAIWPLILIAITAMIITGFATVRYATGLITDLRKLKDFMKEIAHGNLKKDFDYGLMKRNDEITDMCKSATDMQKSLRELIEQDALTLLENRRSANKLLNTMHKKLVEEKEKYVLVLGDIDFFKKVNDTYGHDAGAEVLKGVAQILKNSMRGKGFAARWGGEEFLLGFRGYSMSMAAAETEKILEEIRKKRIQYEETEICVTMSFGIAKGKEDGTVDSVIKEADDRLYYAKSNGRNQVVFPLEEDEPKQEEDKNVKKEEQPIEVDEELLDYIKELKGENDGGADI